MAAFFLLLSFLVAPLLFLFLRRSSPPTVNRFPPGPKKLPIIGNLHQLTATPHQSLRRLSLIHGPLIGLTLGSVPTLVVSSADLAREVLKTNDADFCNRPRLSASTKYSYDCLDVSFSPYGEYWRKMKKLYMLELFSAKKLLAFGDIIEEEVAAMVDKIAAAALQTSPAAAAVVNLREPIVALANDVICRLALGTKFQEKQKHSGDQQGRLPALFKEIQECFSAFYVADYWPAFGWIDRLTGAAGKLHRSWKEMDEFYEEVIDAHIAYANSSSSSRGENGRRTDVVDVLLEIQKETGCLTRNHIKAVLKDMFIAGTETASATVGWAMAELVRRPEDMKRAQQEVRAAVGAKNRIDCGDLPSLQFLKCVVKETFRLHPPAPFLLAREAIRRTSVGGFDVRQGTRLFVNAYAIGRDSNSWKCPDEFMPERFLTDRCRSVDVSGRDFELLPFGSGRRICPAMQFGLTTVELALANLLCWFDWGVPDGMRPEDVDMEEAPGIVVHNKAPLRIEVKKIFVPHS